MYVYFGTQTGTAESFARDLEREGADRGLVVHVVDLEDAVVADADADDNARKIKIAIARHFPDGHVRRRRTAGPRQPVCADFEGAGGVGGCFGIEQECDAAPATHLHKDLEFAVFGLGNRQYDHFNAMGKFFDAALERSGGRRLLPLGLGDDDDDLENDFETWKEQQLWPLLMEKYHPEVHKEEGAATTNGHGKKKNEWPDCPLQVVYHDSSSAETQQPVYDLPADQIHSSSRHYFTAVDCPVTAVRELRDDVSDGESTVHVEIDISRATALSGPKT